MNECISVRQVHSCKYKKKSILRIAQESIILDASFRYLGRIVFHLGRIFVRPGRIVVRFGCTIGLGRIFVRLSSRTHRYSSRHLFLGNYIQPAITLSSSLFLKTAKDGAVLSSTGRRFHLWTTLYEKNACLCLLPFDASSFTRRAPFLASRTSQNSFDQSL